MDSVFAVLVAVMISSSCVRVSDLDDLGERIREVRDEMERNFERRDQAAQDAARRMASRDAAIAGKMRLFESLLSRPRRRALSENSQLQGIFSSLESRSSALAERERLLLVRSELVSGWRFESEQDLVTALEVWIGSAPWWKDENTDALSLSGSIDVPLRVVNDQLQVYESESLLTFVRGDAGRLLIRLEATADPSEERSGRCSAGLIFRCSRRGRPEVIESQMTASILADGRLRFSNDVHEFNLQPSQRDD